MKKKLRFRKKRWINYLGFTDVFVGDGERLGRVSWAFSKDWRAVYYLSNPQKVRFFTQKVRFFTHRYQAKRWVEMMHEKWGKT